MFNLDLQSPPTTLSELTTAVDRSLSKWILLPANISPVHAQGTLPKLSSFSVTVTGGKIAGDSLPFQTLTGPLAPGPTAEQFSISAKPITVSDIPVHLELTATNAAFAYGQSADGKLIAALQDAADGHLAVQINHADLEAGLLQLARQFVGDAVTLQKIDIAFTPISPTEIHVLLKIAAKKFVSTLVTVNGKLKIDDQLVATASDLKASADGMVGSIAVGMLQPQLHKIQGKPLPLMAFSLGNVKLRGVEIHTANGVEITARFGSSPS
jgi:hypothetical protein